MDIKDTIENNFIPLDLTIEESPQGLKIGDTPATNTVNVNPTSPNNAPANSNIIPSGGGSIVKGFLKTQNYNVGVSGWSINEDGSVDFNDGNFRGIITATTGSIGGWTISSSALYFDGATDALSAGMAPADYPFYAGKKYADRATAVLKIEPSGKLTCTDIVATGVINAQSGYLSSGVYVDTVNGILCESGGLNVGNAGHIRGGSTDYNTGAGFFLGYSSAAYKLSIGNPSDTSKLLLWDGTNLIVNGTYLSFNTIYGDASDGDVTISTDTTLTSDMFYDTLTVNSTKTLNTAGYRIFANLITGGGTISNNGGDGGDAVDGSRPVTNSVPGTAGVAAGSGSTIATVPGEIGADQEGNGVNGDAVAKSIGVAGVAGGDGGKSNVGVAHTGGTAGAQTGTVYNKINNINSAYYLLDTQPTIAQFTLSSGSGSGAGGEGGSQAPDDGAGGGSGAPGGLLWIAAKNITGTLTFEAKGGDGGDGADGISIGDGAGGGGGGAGSGGIIMVIYSEKTGITTSVVGGMGGSPGTGGSQIAATAGGNGTAGSVVYIQA